jgi:hypothetical protein
LRGAQRGHGGAIGHVVGTQVTASIVTVQAEQGHVPDDLGV